MTSIATWGEILLRKWAANNSEGIGARYQKGAYTTGLADQRAIGRRR